MRSLGSVALTLLLSAVAASAQCVLTAPKVDLLSAKGLASPWVLSNCKQFDPNTQTFMEATIYEPKENKIFAYSPLVIDNGTRPLAHPVVPKISKHAIIVYHFGCNAQTLTLADKDGGNTLKKANCVNGLLPNSVFGQFAYCNAPNFFHAAKRVVTPPLGRARDGSRCPTTRNFAIVDQDQSDNVVTTYLVKDQRTAQNTAINRRRFKGATVVSNPSDNALLSKFINPAIGCKSFAIPALDDHGTMRTTLASDELMATAHQAPPVALVPPNDPMVVLANGDHSIRKVNLYRIGVNQPLHKHGQTSEAYCKLFAEIAPPVILRQRRFTDHFMTPAKDMATNLFTFLGVRFNTSWINLNCIHYTGKQSPIVAHLTNGVADMLTFHIDGKTIGPLP